MSKLINLNLAFVIILTQLYQLHEWIVLKIHRSDCGIDPSLLEKIEW